MTDILREKDLEIRVENALNARMVDDPDRELQHCMRTVDFIIERQDSYYFIEFKDPEHPQSTAQARREFIDGMESGGLDEDLKYKYRDSFLYEWAAGRADKPIYYWVLIGLARLSTSELQRRTDSLRRILPVQAPTSWERPIVSGCGVFNIATWNRNFPELAVRRLSAPAGGGL